jgi:RimJ/RimL family protein N-acetyltransferase
MKLIDAVVLKGSLVRLEPLDASHVPGLQAAAEEDRSAYDWTFVPRSGEVAGYVAAQLTRDGLTPFAQIRVSDEAPVGCTALWDPRTWPGREDLCAVMIGWTWLAASAQRTGINAEAKLLLLRHAFDELGVARVDLMTDARNQRSRRAIERLGARFEGVLRNWSPSHATGEEGRLRDSAMFSVTAAEWPAVQSALSARVANGGTVALAAWPRAAGGPCGDKSLADPRKQDVSCLCRPDQRNQSVEGGPSNVREVHRPVAARRSTGPGRGQDA